MKKIALAILVALLAPYSLAHAGSMLEGGTFGMVSFAGNVTINPSFGYYPAVRAEFGVGKFLIAGSVGGVFAGDAPDQVVGVDGAFQLFNMGMGKEGAMFLYIMGGIQSEQGTYSLIVDGTQYKIGPKVYFDFDAKSATPNTVSLYIAVPFMTAEVATEPSTTLESIKYLAVEGGLSFKL